MQEQLKLDLFTSLYNKKTFDDYLPKLMEECQSANVFLSLAIIDVDNFKCTNDLYGHTAGNRVSEKFEAHLISTIHSLPRGCSCQA